MVLDRLKLVPNGERGGVCHLTPWPVEQALPRRHLTEDINLALSMLRHPEIAETVRRTILSKSPVTNGLARRWLSYPGATAIIMRMHTTNSSLHSAQETPIAA